MGSKAMERDVDITNRNGNRLAGTLRTRETIPKEIVVLCHGLLCHKDFLFLPALAQSLEHDSFRFDFSGNGKSEGECKGLGGYLDEIEDLRDVITYWRNRKVQILGIIGHSKGGNVVLLYAAKYSDVPIVVSIASRADMRSGLGKQRFGDAWDDLERTGKMMLRDPLSGRQALCTAAQIEERRGIDMGCISNIKGCSVLFIHGTNDRIIPPKDAQWLHDHCTASTACLEFVDKADHSFLIKHHRDALLQIICRFFEEKE